MLPSQHNPHLDFRTLMRLWPLLAAGLLGLWALTAHAPHALGGVMALLHLVYVFAAIWLLMTAFAVSIRPEAMMKVDRPDAPPAADAGPPSRKPEPSTPPPRATVRD
ncbi:MAG: hypothetical protein B7X46_12375 [Thiomonas sp. 15-66-11]|jgi:hypothetical protein|uniref:hypothetical protein n=1 Tax=Thiomonas sp. TaxID=2047785 RepID=UPI000BD01920|nr:hypothetical protein [Thiomonas sp.]OZB43528.1 MAG: hypothetical protein B7X46_12375 [Thiomonas sp. 15-66-11]